MISLVIGRQGSGKTLYLVKTALDGAKAKKKVYSNIHLTGIKYKPIEYEDIINCKYNNAIVIIDEGHQLLPSRAAMSKTSRLIVDKFVSMTRKKKVHLLLSTQMLRKIDVRIRIEYDFLIECQKYAFINKQFKVVLGDENLPKDVPIIIKTTVTEQYSGKSIISSFMANELYPMYDTRQIIDIVIPEPEK